MLAVEILSPVNIMAKTAIIVDIDGTVALRTDRSPFQWHKVGNDQVHQAVQYLLANLNPKILRIFVSGRDEVCRKETEDWLKENKIHHDFLYMRVKNDNRKDSIIKEEIYMTHIKGNYNVIFVLDDRDQVVKLWRSLGLVCLQVAEGNF